MERKKITPDYLRECLSYSPCDGSLTWLKRPPEHFLYGSKSPEHQAAIWNAKYSGKAAFTSLGNHGYHTSTVSGIRLLAHRVSWAIFHGEWPDGEIDHINGIRTDNRMKNLRDISRSENSKNLSVRSGAARGVYWYQPTSRWSVKIQHEGKMRHVGYFKDRDEAIEARRAAERQYGFHENHGRAF